MYSVRGVECGVWGGVRRCEGMWGVWDVRRHEVWEGVRKERVWGWVHTGRKGRSIHLQFCKFCVGYIHLSSPPLFLLNFFLPPIHLWKWCQHAYTGGGHQPKVCNATPNFSTPNFSTRCNIFNTPIQQGTVYSLYYWCTLHQRYVYSKHLPGCTVATAAVRHQSIRYPTNLLLSCRNMTITYGYF